MSNHKELQRLLTSTISYRELEARIAFDAAIVATAVETIADEPPVNAESTEALEPESNSSPATDSLTAALAALPGETATSSGIVFIDASIADLDTLIASIDTAYEIVLLEANRDGVEQIAEVLSARSGVEAIHFVSHGDQAELFLGTARLTLQSMDGEYADELAVIGEALTDNGDLLIYGCNFGEGELGQEAASRLAELTGADVAASTDLTGHVDRGGDWDLEFKVGSVETAAAVDTAAAQEWAGLLTETTLVSHEPALSELPDKSHEVKSDQNWGQTFSYDSPGATYEVDKVGLVFYRDSDASSQTITVSIRSSWNGATIASGTISSTSLSVGESWATVDLSSTATLNDNTTYYIRVGSNTQDGKIYVGIDNASAIYPDGDAIDKDGIGLPGQDAAFRIIDVNAAPVITSGGGGATANVNAAENQTSVTTVTASDADVPANTLTFSITGGADAALFSINATNGVVTFDSAPDFETPTDFDGDGVYEVTVEVADGNGDSDSQAISVTVTDDSTETVADNFDDGAGGSSGYSGNDGTQNWTGDWQELGESNGPFSGRVRADGTPQALEIGGEDVIITGRGALREADLTGATSATLTFDVWRSVGRTDGSVTLAISNNGGGSWTTLQTYTIGSGTPTSATAQNFDISAYVASNTQIRFLGSGLTGDDPSFFYADNVQIEYTVDNAAVITGDIGYSGNEGDAVAGDLDASDVEGLTDGTYFTVTTPATNGTAAIDATTGAWTFTPTDPNWFGSDAFTVTVTDDLGGTTTQLVSITLANVNDAPVITGDISYSGNEGDAVAGDLDATDVEGLTDGTYFTVTTPATNGTAAIDATTGAWTFTPTDPNWFGSDAFTVTVTDDLGGTTTQLVSITLANVDDAAVITGDIGYAGNEGDAVAGDLDATDVEGLTDGTYFTVTTPATNGTAAIDAATGAWTFTPTDPNWFGSDSFTVTVTDDLGGTTTQLVSITLANVDDATVITGDVSYSGNEGDAVAGDLDASDVGGLTDLTYFTVTTPATNGTAAIDAATGAWTFTPTDPNWFGSDSFTVTVTDDLGGTTTQLVSITLANVDDATVITGDVSYAGNEGDAVAGDLDASDVEGLTDLTYFTVTTPATNGTAAIDAATGAWTFTPTDPNWFGSDSFTVTVTDDLGGTTTQLVSITLANVNDAPAITSNGGGAAANVNAAEDQNAVTTVTSTDVDGGAPAYAIIGGADQALFSIDAAGVLTFNTAPDFEAPGDAGADNVYDVIVEVSDGSGGTDTQAIAVAVANVNDAPAITSDGGGAAANVNAAENQNAVTTVTSTDVDGGAPAYAIIGGADQALFSIDAAGVLTFNTAPDFEAPGDAGADNVYNVIVEVSDGNGGTDTQAMPSPWPMSMKAHLSPGRSRSRNLSLSLNLRLSRNLSLGRSWNLSLSRNLKLCWSLSLSLNPSLCLNPSRNLSRNLSLSRNRSLSRNQRQQRDRPPTMKVASSC